MNADETSDMARLPSLRDARGFTLVEVLVVTLIIGVLVGIALPAFLQQRAKAQDAEAKTAAVTASKAMEAWHLDRDTYAEVTPARLGDIEPALREARGLTVVSAVREAYEVSVDSASGTSGGGPFRVVRDDSGLVTRTCDDPGHGSCPDDARW